MSRRRFYHLHWARIYFGGIMNDYKNEIEKLYSEIAAHDKEWKELKGTDAEKEKWRLEKSIDVPLRREKIRFLRNPTETIYSMSKPGAISILPMIAFLVLLGAIGYDYFTTETVDPTLIIILIVAAIFTLPLANAEGNLIEDAYFSIKRSFADFPNLPIGHTEGLIYTRSAAEFFFWKASRIVQISFTFVVLAALILLAFSALSAVTIAPTTIIIILLVMIIANQNK